MYVAQYLPNRLPRLRPISPKQMYWEHLRQGLQSTGESFRHGGGMIAGGEGAFRASYLCESIDELAGATPRAWACK